jgi:hypothetical protein
MKIISDFKDYYDHVGHLYGQPDNKVTYVRRASLDTGNTPKRSKDDTIGQKSIKATPLDVQVPWLIRTHWEYWREGKEYQSSSLLVCGRIYPVVWRNKTVNSLRPDIPELEAIPPHIPEVLFSKDTVEDNYRWLYKLNPIETSTIWDKGPEPLITDILKRLEQPVLIAHSSYKYPEESTYIYRSVPNLGKLGLSRYVPAEILYQEIEYWLMNILKESPDVQPTGKPPQTNLEKIEAHGFDKRVSFRHRK